MLELGKVLRVERLDESSIAISNTRTEVNHLVHYSKIEII